MKITNKRTPQSVSRELTARLARIRIKNGLTQAELAKQSGVSKRTVERIENGSDPQLTTLVRLMRVLGLSEALDQLIPEKTVSPMDILHGKTSLPKRVKPKKSNKSDAPWRWGDEQ